MKVALVTDLHFGVRNDHTLFAEYQQRFFENTFWPKVKAECDAMICLGDTFDRRRYINYKSLTYAKQMFFDHIAEWGKPCHMIIGNHDTYYRKKNEINSPSLLYSQILDNTHFYQSVPEEVQIGDVDVLMVPWIASEHAAEAGDIISKSNAQVVFGHLEVNGFPMHPGMVCQTGADPAMYKKYEQVYSGHFHHQTKIGNIHYIGNAYQLTWSDYGDDRGFHIWDTATLDTTFYKNPERIFEAVNYDDSDAMVPVPSNLKNKMVKVFVKKKENPTFYDNWLTSIQDQDPADLSIIENMTEMLDGEVMIETRDTLKLLKEYVDLLELGKGGDELVHLLSDLYQEAGQTKDII